MKKLNFKVGDWVTLDSEICKILEDNGSTYKVKVYRSLERSHPDYLIQDAFKEYIQEWVPKQYEYCWSNFYGLVQIVNVLNYKFEVRCFYGIKNLYDNPIVELEELEPFIGELPKRVNDFKELK